MSSQDQKSKPITPRPMTGIRLKQYKENNGLTIADMVYLLGSNSNQVQRIYSTDKPLQPRVSLFARLLIDHGMSPLPPLAPFKEVLDLVRSVLPELDVAALATLIGLRKQDGERLMLRPEATNAVRWHLYFMHSALTEQRGNVARKAALATFVQSCYTDAMSRYGSPDGRDSNDWPRAFFKLLQKHSELLAMINEEVDIEGLTKPRSLKTT